MQDMNFFFKKTIGGTMGLLSLLGLLIVDTS